MKVRQPSSLIISAGSEITLKIINNRHSYSSQHNINDHFDLLRMQIEDNKRRKKLEKEREKMLDLKLEMDNIKYFEMKQQQNERYLQTLNKDLYFNNRYFPLFLNSMNKNRILSKENYIHYNRENNNLFGNINQQSEDDTKNEEREDIEKNQSDQEINSLINKLSCNKLKDVNKLSNKECVICMEYFI